MPRNRSAISALQKLEADRKELDERQRLLEDEAAREIGRVILGTGLERFSQKGLKRIAGMLAERGEAGAIELLAGANARTKPVPSEAK